jgi:hypothetical protein
MFSDLSAKFSDKMATIFDKVAKKNEQLAAELKEQKAKFDAEAGKSIEPSPDIKELQLQIGARDNLIASLEKELADVKSELKEERDMNKSLNKNLKSLSDAVKGISADIETFGDISPTKKLDQLAAAASDQVKKEIEKSPKAKSVSSFVGEKRAREKTCSNCKKTGHNKRGCKNAKKESDEEEEESHESGDTDSE